MATVSKSILSVLGENEARAAVIASLIPISCKRSICSTSVKDHFMPYRYTRLASSCQLKIEDASVLLRSESLPRRGKLLRYFASESFQKPNSGNLRRIGEWMDSSNSRATPYEYACSHEGKIGVGVLLIRHSLYHWMRWNPG